MGVGPATANPANSGTVQPAEGGSPGGDVNDVFVGMFLAALSGDSASVSLAIASSRHGSISKDISAVNKDLDTLSPLETSSESLKQYLNSIFQKGGKVQLTESIKTLIAKMKEASTRFGIQIPDSVVQKILNGQELSGKEAHELYNWLSDIQLKVIPPDKNMQASSAKLQNLQAEFNRIKQWVDAITDALLSVPVAR